MKILIAMDNPRFMVELSHYFEQLDFEVEFAYSPSTVTELFRQCVFFDIILIGFNVRQSETTLLIQNLREKLLISTPIICISNENELIYKKRIFEAGVDDYLVIPFFKEELVLRIHAVQRRGRQKKLSKVKTGDLEICFEKNEIRQNEQTIHLNRIQQGIFKILVLNAPEIVRRDEILTNIWGNNRPNSDALKSHMYSIRRLINWKNANLKLETIRNQGYRIQYLQLRN